MSSFIKTRFRVLNDTLKKQFILRLYSNYISVLYIYFVGVAFKLSSSLFNSLYINTNLV